MHKSPWDFSKRVEPVKITAKLKIFCKKILKKGSKSTVYVHLIW